MKLDIVAPGGPSAVMYAIGCLRRAALDITWLCSAKLGDEACSQPELDMASKTSADSARFSAQDFKVITCCTALQGLTGS